MSLEHARKFVVDFDADPKIRIRMAEIKKEMQENNSENCSKMDLIFAIAKERGYEFTADELKEANNCMFGEISDDELLNVAGGLDINYDALSKVSHFDMSDIFNMSID